MNPRRVHHLMKDRFPQIDHAKCDWHVLPQESPSLRMALAAFIREHIQADHVLFEAHRKMAGYFSITEAANFMATHVGVSEIRVADREFRQFVVVGQPGVIAALLPSRDQSVSSLRS